MNEAIGLNLKLIKEGGKKVYTIEESKCAECGVCTDCPSGAITDE
jgi:NAD-dependent dihydropyrimidine dehydrogenase PreA subunit